MDNNNRFYTVKKVIKHNFYQVPKLFFNEGSKYFKMSPMAKLAYSILADRNSLSLKNGWFDKENRLFFIYSQKDLATILSIKDLKTVRKYLCELEEYGLLYREKQGYQEVDRLYLLELEVENNITKNNEELPIDKQYQQMGKNSLPRQGKNPHLDGEKSPSNKTNNNKTNNNENKNKSSSITIEPIEPTQEPKSDDDLSTLLKFCAKNNFKLSRINANNLLTCYGLDKILKAINRALATNTEIKSPYAYLSSILLDLDKGKNIDIINNKKESLLGNFGNYEQRSYDFDDLENRLLGLA